MWEKERLEPLSHESLMPSGKYKGKKMQDIPAEYLVGSIAMFTPRVRQYVETNLEALKKQLELNKIKK